MTLLEEESDKSYSCNKYYLLHAGWEIRVQLRSRSEWGSEAPACLLVQYVNQKIARVFSAQEGNRLGEKCYSYHLWWRWDYHVGGLINEQIWYRCHESACGSHSIGNWQWFFSVFGLGKTKDYSYWEWIQVIEKADKEMVSSETRSIWPLESQSWDLWGIYLLK